jgi:hypothetical protein
MAADWIKMRVDLQSHPKVVRILSATSTDKFRVIGGLLAVWCVFDTHSTDGVLHGYTPETMDHVIGWEGFTRAMESVGWMAFDGLQTLSLPEFDTHNGQSAKRRAEDQKRKKNDRNPVRILSAELPDKKRTREEKRREDKEQEKRAKEKPIFLTDWITALEGDAVPADDPLFAWAATVGLPREWIALAWWAFEGSYTGDGQGRAKKYTDWRATFRNAVKNDWLKLWRVGTDGGYFLTTAGQQAQREMKS